MTTMTTTDWLLEVDFDATGNEGEMVDNVLIAHNYGVSLGINGLNIYQDVNEAVIGITQYGYVYDLNWDNMAQQLGFEDWYSFYKSDDFYDAYTNIYGWIE